MSVAPADAELVVVLSALAGVRRGQHVRVLGAAPLLRAALSAASGVPEQAGPVDVVVTVAAHDVPCAVASVRTGGRLVSVAADRAAAARTADRHGLLLRHTEAVGARTAWSASAP